MPDLHIRDGDFVGPNDPASNQELAQQFVKVYQDTIKDYFNAQKRVLMDLRHGLGKISIPIPDNKLAIEVISEAFCTMLTFIAPHKEAIEHYVRDAVEADRSGSSKRPDDVLLALENAMNVVAGSKFRRNLDLRDVAEAKKAIIGRKESPEDFIVVAIDRYHKNRLDLIEDLQQHTALSNSYLETDKLPLLYVDPDTIEILVEKGDMRTLSGLLSIVGEPQQPEELLMQSKPTPYPIKDISTVRSIMQVLLGRGKSDSQPNSNAT